MTVTAERLKEAMADCGVDQSGLARELGVTQGAISKIVLGKTANSRLMPKIATTLRVPLAWLLGMSDDRQNYESVVPVANDAGDEVDIEQLDLAYGMGGTFLDVGDIESETARFSRAWLRQFTDAPPHLLFSAKGIGDSMMPTIHDRDVIIVDRSDTRPRLRDQIWAIAHGDIGMVKRLRPMPDGTMRIVSDNPAVPEDLAADGELHIVGRVVAICRKV